MQHEAVKYCLIIVFIALSHWHIQNLACNSLPPVCFFSTQSMLKTKLKICCIAMSSPSRKYLFGLLDSCIQLCHSAKIQLPGKCVSKDICLLSNIYQNRHGDILISWLHLWKFVWLILRGIILCEGNSKYYPLEWVFRRWCEILCPFKTLSWSNIFFYFSITLIK